MQNYKSRIMPTSLVSCSVLNVCWKEENTVITFSEVARGSATSPSEASMLAGR